MEITRRTFATLAVCGAAGLLGAAGPDGYPSRTVRIVVPFPPGGTTDLVARLIATRLAERTGTMFIIENKPGASGIIGTEQVARATPDGTTLLFATINTHGINAAVFKSLPYDAVRDFAPISLVVTTPNVLLVNPSVAARTVEDVLRLAREKPGELAFGSTAHGGSPHMAGVLLQTMTGIELNHIPYKGGGPMLNDLIAGHIPLAFDNLPSSIGQIRAGALRAIAVTTRERASSTPDVPTMAETVPGYEVSAWFGMLAPAHTPEPIVRYLSDQVAEIVREPAMRERFLDLGANPVGNTPAAFAEIIKAEVEKWKQVGEVATIRIE